MTKSSYYRYAIFVCLFVAIIVTKGWSDDRNQMKGESRSAVDVWMDLTRFRFVPTVIGSEKLQEMTRSKVVIEDEKDWILLGRSITDCEQHLVKKIESLLGSNLDARKIEYYLLIKCVYALGCIADAPPKILTDERLIDVGGEVSYARIEACAKFGNLNFANSLVRRLNDSTVPDIEKVMILGSFSGSEFEEMVDYGFVENTRLSVVRKMYFDILSSLPKFDNPRLELFRMSSLQSVGMNLGKTEHPGLIESSK